MNNIVNKILFCSKIVLLLIAFTITLYILLMRMDSYDLSTMSIFPLFIPLLLVLIAFVFSIFLNIGKDNIFFNIVCVLVLLSIVIIDYRTVFDSNIISKTALNIYFFDSFTNKIKFMLYLLFVSNFLIMIYEKKDKIHS